MMSTKMTTLDLLKIKLSENNSYDVKTSVHHINNKILSRDSKYTVDVVMWPKFGNFKISMREVITTSIL